MDVNNGRSGKVRVGGRTMVLIVLGLAALLMSRQAATERPGPMPPSTVAAPAAMIYHCPEGVADGNSRSVDATVVTSTAPQGPSHNETVEELSRDRGLVVIGCMTRRKRLTHWQTAGIRFEGNWEAEQIDVVVDVLDRFALAFGEAQLLRLIQEALRLYPAGRAEHLTVVRVSDPTLGAAGWAPLSGEVRVNDVLFDEAAMARRYRWAFFDSYRAISSHAVSREAVVLAHELGHVIVDSIRAATADPGAETHALEEAYAGLLSLTVWPHPTHPINENLATEVGLWALGVTRPAPVRLYRQLHLGPALAGATAMSLP